MVKNSSILENSPEPDSPLSGPIWLNCTAPEWNREIGSAFAVEKPGGFAMLAISNFSDFAL
jgi:hypothetical protein